MATILLTKLKYLFDVDKKIHDVVPKRLISVHINCTLMICITFKQEELKES